MEAVFAWGLALIRAIQTIEHPFITAIMKAASLLGTELGYLALLVALYWCVDERRGVRVAVMVLLSAWVNIVAKAALAQPRPYELDPLVGRAVEKTYGLPSGHAQQSLVFWPLAASWARGKSGLAAAILLGALPPLVIAFSRLYLGVHFPTDLVGGWLLAGLLLAGYAFLEKPISVFLAKQRPQVRAYFMCFIAFAMASLHRQDVSVGAVFLGTTLGYILMTSYFPFDASKGADGGKARLPALLARLAVGLPGVALAYLGLKFIFPGKDSELYLMFRFIRYGLLGLWVSAGAPWVFLKLKLAGTREQAAS